MLRLPMDRTKPMMFRFAAMAFVAAASMLLFAGPVHAVNPANTMLANPESYFPGCTCQVMFLCFIAWMICLVIIAMFQYGEYRKKKLSAAGFSVVAIILVFIIYSIALWIMVWMLQPSGFEINPESGQYEFSKHGEKESGEMHFTGVLTPEELEKHIRSSRTNIVTTWAILSVFCVGAMAFVPAYLKRQAVKKEQMFSVKRKKRPSKGRIGTRTLKDKEGKIIKRKDKKDKRK